MKNLKEFNIPFVGLKEGVHIFEYKVDNSFFNYYNFDEYNDSKVNVVLTFTKKPTLFELTFSAKGFVNLPCDLTNELYDQDIDGVMNLIVKFGPQYNDDHDEVLILPHEAFEINIAQYIYELIILSVPLKRTHPKVLDGTIKNPLLENFETKENNKNKTVEEESTDPRWDKLKDLLTGKNK